jgi:hypothetical protein
MFNSTRIQHTQSLFIELEYKKKTSLFTLPLFFHAQNKAIIKTTWTQRFCVCVCVCF